MMGSVISFPTFVGAASGLPPGMAGLTGATGPAGPTGPRGAAGPQGAQGPRGVDGVNAGISSYLVSGLPVGSAGTLAYATNGRKIGEGSGVGTGVPVYYSAGAWRVFATDAPVLS